MDKPRQWPQEVVIKPMEEILVPTTNSSFNNLSKASSSSFERRVIRPAAHKAAAAVKCPRCDSANTKFCYYNNYSLSQPRYFCKSCRRYWTEGGTLRNIPVGGGSRKNSNKIRSSSSSSSSSSSTTRAIVISENPPAPLTAARIHHDEYYGEDLNLGFPSSAKINVYNDIHGALALLPHFDGTGTTCCSSASTTSSTSTSHQLSALELLTGITTSTMMPIPVPDPNYSVYSSVVGNQLMSEFKIPSLSFSLDQDDHGILGSTTAGHESNSCRSGSGRPPFMFPSFEDHQLKKLTNTPETHDDHPHVHVEQNKDNDDSNGFWNGFMGTGGGSW